MKRNPILEEVWRIKEQLAAEAGYDVRRFGDQLREWTQAHPEQFPPAKDAEELGESKDVAPLTLREEPPKA